MTRPQKKKTFAMRSALACMWLLLSGCASNLYLAESDIAAIGANMRTAARADALLADLQGEMLDVSIATSTGPHFSVQSSNTLQILENMQRLRFIADTWSQLRLDRLAVQLDEQLSDWLETQTLLLRRQGGSRIRITRIDRITVRVVEAPTFTYDTATQTIRFELKATSSAHGRMYHKLFEDDVWGDIASFFVGLFGGSNSVEGDNAVILRVRDLPVTGVISLRNYFQNASSVHLRLSFDASAADVVVTGGAPNDVRVAIANVVRHNLGREYREDHSLLFNHFALSDLRLADGAGGVAELTHKYRSRLERAAADLDVVVRGRDRALYHSRRRNNVFIEHSPIDLSKQILSDPALVTSAPGRLELVAVAADGDLIHARNDGAGWTETWRASDDGALDRYLADSRIALIATGPGQLELVAVGESGGLSHLRRRNGAWAPQAGIVDLNNRSGTILKDPLLVQVGFKVLLVCWDKNRRLYAAVFDLESGEWGQPTQLGANVAHAPAAVLLDDWRVGVAFNTRDGHLRYRQLGVHLPSIRSGVGSTHLTVWPEVTVGSEINGPPEFAPTGYNSAQLAVRGRDKRLKVNHLVGGGWQGWIDVHGAFFGTPSNSKVSTTFAMQASSDGQLHWVGRRGDGRSRAIYNQHPGYFRDPGGLPERNPLHWRGFEDISKERFVGRPALAIADRTTAVAVVDSQLYPWTAIVGGTGEAGFRRFPLRTVVGIDPVVLSTHTGQIDLVFMGDDNRLKHSRRYHDAVHGFTTNLPQGPATIRTLSAVATANQIDVVALGDDRSLYYMRYASGNWQGIVGFGANIISTPAVIGLGSGQLEIFAVDANQDLWRWRLDGGQIGPGARIAVPFDVSAALFSPHALAALGDGYVDIVVAENQTGELHHARFGPNSNTPIHPAGIPGVQPFLFVGEASAGRPVLTAASEKSLQMTIVDRDRRLQSGRFVASAGQVTSRPTSIDSLRRDSRRSDLARPETPTAAVPRATAVGGWGDFVIIDSGPALLATTVRLSPYELVSPVCSASGSLTLLRFRSGLWLPPIPIYGTLPPLPENRPSRLIGTSY